MVPFALPAFSAPKAVKSFPRWSASSGVTAAEALAAISTVAKEQTRCANLFILARSTLGIPDIELLANSPAAPNIALPQRCRGPRKALRNDYLPADESNLTTPSLENKSGPCAVTS